MRGRFGISSSLGPASAFFSSGLRFPVRNSSSSFSAATSFSRAALRSPSSSRQLRSWSGLSFLAGPDPASLAGIDAAEASSFGGTFSFSSAGIAPVLSHSARSASLKSSTSLCCGGLLIAGTCVPIACSFLLLRAHCRCRGDFFLVPMLLGLHRALVRGAVSFTPILHEHFQSLAVFLRLRTNLGDKHFYIVVDRRELLLVLALNDLPGFFELELLQFRVQLLNDELRLLRLLLRGLQSYALLLLGIRRIERVSHLVAERAERRKADV